MAHSINISQRVSRLRGEMESFQGHILALLPKIKRWEHEQRKLVTQQETATLQNENGLFNPNDDDEDDHDVLYDCGSLWLGYLFQARSSAPSSFLS